MIKWKLILKIYAVGDAIEVVDFVTKQNTAIPLAGPANKQGRIAADNIAGLNTAFKGTQGTAIIKIFGLTAASTGNNERTLKKTKYALQGYLRSPSIPCILLSRCTSYDIKAYI